MSQNHTEQSSLKQQKPFHTAPWPVIDDEGKAAVLRVLESGKINYWTGEETKKFEEEFAAYCGVPFALAVSNGTLALELALCACGIGAGDEVIVPSRTFIATAGCVVAVGATPIVCDIDPHTNNMSALTVAKVLTPRTKAIIAVHVGGYPAPMDEIIDLAQQVGAYVLEDCAQAHGAAYHGHKVGSLGDVGCFSFCQDKIMPLGEGGMITFHDREKYERAWSYRDHGRSYEGMQKAAEQPGVSFKWLTDSFGSNARMGEMEGALGRVLLRALPQYHAQRTVHAYQLVNTMNELAGIEPVILDNNERAAGSAHAFYRLYARIDAAALKDEWSRDRILTELGARGVPVQYGSCSLIAHEKAFQRFASAQLNTWPEAQQVHEDSLAFLVHPTLTECDMDNISAALTEVMHRAVKPELLAPQDGVAENAE